MVSQIRCVTLTTSEVTDQTYGFPYPHRAWRHHRGNHAGPCAWAQGLHRRRDPRHLARSRHSHPAQRSGDVNGQPSGDFPFTADPDRARRHVGLALPPMAAIDRLQWRVSSRPVLDHPVPLTLARCLHLFRHHLILTVPVHTAQPVPPFHPSPFFPTP